MSGAKTFSADPPDLQEFPALAGPVGRLLLAIPGGFGMLRAPMSNRAIWSMRKRHEWLATPLKKKRVKKATRLRCGLQDAMDRKGPADTSK